MSLSHRASLVVQDKLYRECMLFEGLTQGGKSAPPFIHGLIGSLGSSHVDHVASMCCLLSSLT